MIKRIARLAVVAAAASVVVLPASSANAACTWTFPRQCIDMLVPAREPICVIDEDTIGLEYCL